MQTNETNDGLSGHEREITRLRELLKNNEFNYVSNLCDRIHIQNVKAGWWNASAIEPLLIATKFALIHSEVSEALEAYRCDTKDAHLTWRSGVAVELADIAIRLFDLAGALAIPLGTVIEEKMIYNAARADHKPGARSAPGGKKF